MRWSVVTVALCALLPAAARACDCCARNATAAECGTTARLEPRRDCACCTVCAAEEGAPCEDRRRPCRKGLKCSSRGVCTAEETCRSDGECASDQFCLGGVCRDPCTLLDPCNSSLKNGVCRTRDHRPVCSCPPGFSFHAESNACVKVGCEDEDGTTVDVGERIFRNDCEQACVCSPGGKFNCTPTTCPPGYYRSGTFRNDSECTELRGSAIAGGCCVNVVCTGLEVSERTPAAAAGAGAAAQQEEPTTTGSVCSFVLCGPGAVCDEGLCSCRPGRSGDPNNLVIGCLASTGESTTTTTSTTITTTTTTEPATTTTTTTTTPPPTTPPAPPATLDMLPLDITHNATTLQLPAAGGRLSYRPAGRPVRQVALEAGRRVVTVTGLQPGTSYTFNWQGDAGNKALRVDTRPGCVTNISSHAIGETYNMGCQSTCVCGGPNQPSCRPRCSFTRGTVTDLSCSERPDLDDPECCVQLVCAVTSTGGRIVDDLLESLGAKEPTTTTTTTSTTTTTATTTTAAVTARTDGGSGSSRAISSAAADQSDPGAPAALTATDRQPKPTLIVTTKSYNSVTLAWDDFKPQAYARGYVAQYRRTGGDQWRRQELQPQAGQNVPLMKIEQLVPRTEYEARVAIYEGRDQDTLGDTTETIRFVTDDGCVDANSTYPVGDRFYRGCEEICFCELRGKVRCAPRCQRPMFRRGAFKDDPLCFEKKMDDCCVIVACSSAQDVDTVVEASADGLDPCDSVLCDKNYVCEVMTKEGGDVTSAAMCVCPPGFTEQSEGTAKTCQPEAKTTPPTVPKAGCTYGNATYQPGDEFFDGCEFKCMCNNEEEVECKARCPNGVDPERSQPTGCRLVPDPADQCCTKRVCDSTTESAAAAGDVAGGDADCEHEGQRHPANSTFDRGCERCLCKGSGELSCKSRCSPQEPLAGASCTSRPDPADPCCNITVCRPAETSTGRPETAEPAGIRPRLGAARLEKRPDLRVTELRPSTATSSQLKLLISDAILDSILSSSTRPLLVEWRYDDSSRWQAAEIGIDDFSVETLDTLVMTVEGLQRPRQARVRVSYASQTSPVVRGEDVVPLDATPPPPASAEVTTEGRCGAFDQGFRCGDGTCIPAAQRCDFLIDCRDESDETFCDVFGETVVAPAAAALESTAAPEVTTLRPEGCLHDGKLYKVGDEFQDGCRQFCICGSAGKMCAPIRCPVRFGLDLINPDCLKWEVPRNPDRQPPHCCGEAVCKDDGHCIYQGQKYRNQHEIPQHLTGCHQRCYCEFGKVNCQPDCPVVSPTAPAGMNCPFGGPELVTGPNGCCQFWQCSAPEDVDAGNELGASVGPSGSVPPGQADGSEVSGSGGQVEVTESVPIPSATVRPVGSGPVREPSEGAGKPADPDTDAPKQPEEPKEPGEDPLVSRTTPEPEKQRPPKPSRPSRPIHFTHRPQRPPLPPPPRRPTPRPGRPIHFPESPERPRTQRPLFAEDTGDTTLVKEPPGSVPSPVNFPVSRRKEPPATTTAEPELTVPPALMLENVVVEAVDPSSIQINFTLPSQFVGRDGKAEVFYTSNTGLFASDGSLASWDRRVFVTPSGRLESSDYSWTLGDLMPDTEYLLQTTVIFDEGTTNLQGGVHEVRTPPQPTPGTTLPPKVALDAALVATDINTTWAKIGWRRLNETELKYIDGIQLRYRDVDVDAQVWTMTPFIHRELTQYELTDLKPGTRYEVDIVLMPFQDKNTEMVSERPLRIRTLPVVDPYNFNLTLTLAEVKPSSVRVEWSGIPDPQYKYVNVYRIVYIYEKEREEKHTFKLAKTSDQPSLLLKGLKPSSKYQVWLEAYLKNGKKRVSEVHEFVTKLGEIGKAEEIKGDEKEPGETHVAGAASYFSGMVVAAIVAALAILLAIVCAICLVRKSSHAKAPITPARKNGPSYENPAFKSADLDLNGSNGNDRFA